MDLLIRFSTIPVLLCLFLPENKYASPDTAKTRPQKADSGALLQIPSAADTIKQVPSDTPYSLSPAAINDAGVPAPPDSPTNVQPSDTSETLYDSAAIQAAPDTSSRPGPYELVPARVKERAHPIHRQKAISHQKLTRLQIQKVPAAQGDPLRVLATLPGVSNLNDFSAKPIVRGGKMEETRAFWDGIPLMQPFHFMGIYSLFNAESIESMTLYSGAFPIQGRNALSGALFMESRPAPLDSMQLSIDLSMLRGHSYFGVPVVKNRFGAYASFQALWYDFVFHRLWNLADLLSSGKSNTESHREYNKYIDLPNFRDLQWGAHGKLSENLTLRYNGLRSRDVFTIMDRMMRYYVDGEEVSPMFWYRHKYYSNLPNNTRKAGLDIDTLSIVRIKNNVHHLRLRWEPSPKLVMDNTLGLQRQTWHTNLYNDESWKDTSPDPYTFSGYKVYDNPDIFELDREMRSWQTQIRFDGFKKHILTGGVSYDFLSEHFNLDLIRIGFEMLYNGNNDFINTLGTYDPEGYAIIQDTSIEALRDADYFDQFAEQIVMKHRGNVWAGFYGFFLGDEWEISPGFKIDAGLRAEYEQRNSDLFFSPRFSCFFNIDSANEFTLAAGLYSQNDHPFYIRFQNPESPAEKSAHVNAEWTYHVTPHYRFEWQNYYKYYYDLQTARLFNTGRLDWANDITIADISKEEFENLPDSLQDTVVSLFGEREVWYSTQGVGHAFGSEISLFYDPVPQWDGWFSAEYAFSKRQDHSKGIWYDFKFNRPWSINWVNRFRFPKGKTELAIRGKWAAGLPYTDYKIPELNPELENTDTLFVVKRRHGRRYVHYSKVDIRLTRHGELAGRPFQTYLGIWNIMNRPNFLLRDSKTDRIRYFDLNYPIPIIFLGMRWDL